MNRLRRAAALSGILLGACYGAWRLLASTDGVVPWLTWPLLVAEVLLVVIYTLDVWATWPASAPGDGGAWVEDEVAVLITTFSEPDLSVRTTLLACLELHEAGEIYLLDDAGRESLRLLAERYGISYLDRPESTGGRAGAIAFGLDHVESDLVLVLSGEQSPQPEILRRALPFMAAEVAVVQIRQDYANVDSVIHSSQTHHDESWQFDVVAPAADSRGAAVWDSPGALVRQEAIRSIGGYPVDSHASELVATSRLQSKGWRIRHLGIPLITGLAPRNLAGFVVQRMGWARGQLGLLFSRDSALRASGLTVQQRLHQLHVGVSHLSALAYGIVGVSLLVAMTQGHVPMAVTPLGITLLVLWMIAMSAGRVAMGQGHLAFGGTTGRNLLTMELRLRALWKVVSRDRRRSAPPTDHGNEVTTHLPALLGFVIALELLLALRLIDAVIGWPLAELGGWELLATLLWAALTASVSLRVVGAFARRRQDRAHHRVGVDYFGRLNGEACWVVDLSAGGAGVVTTVEAHVDDQVRLWIDIGYSTVGVDAIVRSVLPNQSGSRWRLGLQLLNPDDDAVDEILRCVSLGARTARGGAENHAVRLRPDDVIELSVVGDATYLDRPAQVVTVKDEPGRVAIELQPMDPEDRSDLRTGEPRPV